MCLYWLGTQIFQQLRENWKVPQEILSMLLSDAFHSLVELSLLSLKRAGLCKFFFLHLWVRLFKEYTTFPLLNWMILNYSMNGSSLVLLFCCCFYCTFHWTMTNLTHQFNKFTPSYQGIFTITHWICSLLSLAEIWRMLDNLISMLMTRHLLLLFKKHQCNLKTPNSRKAQVENGSSTKQKRQRWGFGNGQVIETCRSE